MSEEKYVPMPPDETDRDELERDINRAVYIGAAGIRPAAGENPLPKTSREFDRKLYDNPAAKQAAKDRAFDGKQTTTDPYSGKTLHRSHTAAENKYKGQAAPAHQAEADHITPLKELHDYTQRRNLNVSDEELAKVANSKENLKVTSKRINASKQERTNSDALKQSPKIRDEVNDGGALKMKLDEAKADILTKGKLEAIHIKNTVNPIAEAGLAAAQKGAVVGLVTQTGINMAQLFRGEKELDEALLDIGKGTLVTTGTAGGVAVLTKTTEMTTQRLTAKLAEQGLSQGGKKLIAETTSKVLTTIGNNAGTIVNVAVSCAGSVVRFAKGEIDGTQLVLELGETGAGLAGSMLIGTTIGTNIGMVLGTAIPIPILGTTVGAIIGGVIGSMIGYFMGSELFRQVKMMMMGQQSKAESLRLQRIYNELAEKIAESRRELEAYLEYVHQEHRARIMQGFSDIYDAVLANNVDGATAALGRICAQFDVPLAFETKSKFDEMMLADAPFKL